MNSGAPTLSPRILIGEDLWALACSVGQEPAEAELVTPLPSRHLSTSVLGRAAFRVVYPDGLQLKVRRHRDLSTAERVLALRSRIDPVHLPEMVAWDGMCHLTEWVEGEIPSRDDPRTLRDIGALLGTMHASALDPQAREYEFRYENWVDRYLRNVTELREAGVLTGEDSESVLDHLSASAPPASDPVIIHADLAPENLVLDPEGTVILIDNENMAVDAPGFDLARTWYRWPLTDPFKGPFLEGYSEHQDPAPFLRFSLFWIPVVLLEAAHFRVRHNTRDAVAPLSGLKTYIPTLGGAVFQGPLDQKHAGK